MRTALTLLFRGMNTVPGKRAAAVAGPSATGSLCPVCLRKLAAECRPEGADVYLVKECPEHGLFRSLIWRGAPAFSSWQRPKKPSPLPAPGTTIQQGCPFDCGLCPQHGQHTCTALIEITGRCNLHCLVCFADAGGESAEGDLSLERAAFLYDRILAASGPCNIQLSGGEPTLHGQLPAIIRMGRDKGFGFLQLNTNGLRLAEEAGFAQSLQAAGLSSVFLQFDGCSAASHLALRGRDLRAIKEKAIQNCAATGLGVVLVPTLVPGVNTEELGDIINYGLAHAPTVRGVHFQPISYFGRYPGQAGDAHKRLTLPELLRFLEKQGGGALLASHFTPPACEHALCSFHANYLITEEGGLTPMGPGQSACCSTGEQPLQPFPAALEGRQKSVAFTARQWGPAAPAQKDAGEEDAETGRPQDDFDRFLARARTHTFAISAMFFQDAWNLDLERLRGCCIHVAAPDGRLIPFCAYNLSAADGTPLYRSKTS